jgi:hypothetical protein
MKRIAQFNLAGALILSLSIFCFSKEPINKNTGAAATVRAFYAFHFKHDFDYTEQGLKRRRRWLDAELYKLLISESKKSQKSTEQNEAPDLNGDPFTNSQEYPTGYRIGKSEQAAKEATVEVILVWKEKNKVIDEKRIRVQLARSAEGWKITNIIAEGDDDLVKFLKRSR